MFISRKLMFLLLIGISINSFAQTAGSVQLANEYYRMGEVDKAKDLYQSLAKNNRNIPLIHKNYMNVLLDLNEYKAASKYIDKVLKWYPQNNNYRVDKVSFFTNLQLTLYIFHFKCIYVIR